MMIFQRPFVALTVGVVLLLNVSACSVDRSEKEGFATASSAYGILAEKSLDLMADFDLDTWSTMLSDSVVYYFPEGYEKKDKKLIGKRAMLAWWKNYIAVSGIKSMSIENASYVPVYIEKKERAGILAGTQVIAYFSNKMIYETGMVSVKMNFIIHFDKNKLIDGYYTYYNMLPITRMEKNKSITGVPALEML